MYKEENIKQSPFLGMAGFGGGGTTLFLGGESKSDHWITDVSDSSYENYSSIAVSAAGESYVCGNSQSYPSFTATLAKYDEYGTKQWIRMLGSGPGTSTNFTAVTIDSNGDIVCLGYANNTGSGTSGDFILVKYNSSGTLVFQKNYYGSSGTYSYSATGDAIFADSVNNYYLLGYSNSSGQGGYDAWFAKVNSTGVVQWQKTLGQSSFDGASRGGICLDGSHNDIFFSIQTNSPPSGHGGQDVAFCRYSNSGTAEAIRCIGDAANNTPRNTKFYNDKIYISLKTSSDVGGNIGPNIVKLSNGTNPAIEWQQKYSDGADQTTDTFYIDGLTPHTDGNIYISGKCQSGLGGYSYNSIYWAKLNGSGDVQFARRLRFAGTSPAVNYDNEGWDHKILGDNIYITGYGMFDAGGADTSHLMYRGLVMKLPLDGSLTGTYGGWTYEAMTITNSSSSLSNINNPSLSDASASHNTGTSTIPAITNNSTFETQYIK